jgi:uncharacterized protein
MMATPVGDSQRIESLDVLRGFALLGILLMNIVGFGLPAAAYSNPVVGIVTGADLWVWAGMELFAEGAMRCLFSILFGAGVVLFTTGEKSKSAGLHYKRTFWLLVFGLVDGYLLLWNGDVLITYALAGAVLFWVRDTQPGRLLLTTGVLIVFMSLSYGAMQYGLGLAKQAADEVERSDVPQSLSADVLDGAEQWYSFAGDYSPTPEEREAELAQRRESYGSAFLWNAEQTNGMLMFVLPVIMFWDALAMMLLGMALYKYGVLQGSRSPTFYWRLMFTGFAVGLSVNALEVSRAIGDDFALLSVFAQTQASYHVGRVGLAMGYIGLLMLLIQKDVLGALRARLAAVGRMALSNYLMHSVICMFVFTGAGFGLVGELTRAQLYIVVVAIWALQLTVSPWWLGRYRFGPLEWLWRGLTYGRYPANRRSIPV